MHLVTDAGNLMKGPSSRCVSQSALRWESVLVV